MRRAGAVLAAAALATPALAVPLAAQRGAVPPRVRTFGAWDVACDPARRCVALGTTDDESLGIGGFLWAARDGDADAPLRMVLGLGADSLPVGSALRLVALDARGRTLAEATVRARRDSLVARHDVAASALDTGTVRWLVDVARTASALRAHRVPGGATVARVSLDGARATFLAIDETQRRLGTVTALVRRGAAPASAVPAAPALPVVRLAPRPAAGALAPIDSATASRWAAAVRRAQRAATAECDVGEGVGLTYPVVAEPLDAARALLLLPCTAGAYNLMTQLWIVPRTAPARATRAAIVAPDGRGGRVDDSDLLVNVGYHAPSRTLSGLSKGRGLADCGVGSTWGWTGRRFELVDRIEHMACRGVSPVHWPTTWRARTVDGP